MATRSDNQGSHSNSTKHKKPTLSALPSETLKTIFSYVSACSGTFLVHWCQIVQLLTSDDDIQARTRDLTRLARVSRAFRDLAAAQLYRHLSHVFTNDERRDGRMSVDYLAGILETLTTADYNYASFIKEISIDADTDSCAEQASREFKYEYTCGKFLNTLILAALKKTTALESFTWNIRVEIGQSVFLILSKIPTLQNLYVRLQPGPSLHSLSITNVIHNPPHPSPNAIPHSHQTPQFLAHQTHHNNPVVFVPTTNPPYMPPPKTTTGKDVKPARRLGTSKPIVAPQNFSRFSGLRTLAVLDIDSHEYIPEIAASVSSSSASLKSLKLSFSESLALKARKKTVAEMSDIDTVVEDVESENFDFQGMGPPPPLPPLSNPGNIFGPTANSSANSQAEVRKERAAQEKALARIFGLDNEDTCQRLLDVSFERAITTAYKDAQTAAKESSQHDKDRIFVRKLKDITAEIHSEMSSAKGYPTKSLRALEKMEKAAGKYLQREDLKESLRATNGSFSQEGETTKVDVPVLGESSNGYSMQSSGDNMTKTTSDAQYFDYMEKVLDDSPHPPVFPFNWHDPKQELQQELLTPESKSQDQNTRDDVSPSSEPAEHFTKPNASYTENVLVPPSMHDGASESNMAGTFQSVGIFGLPTNSFEDNLSNIVDMEHPDDDDDSGDDQESIEDNGNWNDDEEALGSASGAAMTQDIADTQDGQGEESNANISKGKAPMKNGITNFKEERPEQKCAGEPSMENIQQYLRAHHGLSLKSLSIYLIPVKALVLLKAIDISNLKHLTLLNVGLQSPFWAALAQATYPLSLTSIRTDNVTQSFIYFLDRHSGLKELFLFERSRRSKLTSLTPRTTVGIEQIRRQILKRHVGSLRRLVIRNDDDAGWAFNQKSILTLVKLGVNLKELMIGLDSMNLVSRYHLICFLFRINFRHA